MNTKPELMSIMNIKPSNFQVKQSDIIFQDKRTPTSISYGIAIQDPSKEATIQRSHSLCPSKNHFVDKSNNSKNLRYTLSANLGSHISGSKFERGRRMEIGKKLAQNKNLAATNQFNLTMQSAREDCKSDSLELYTRSFNQRELNKNNFQYQNGTLVAEIKTLDAANSVRYFNMSLNDYEDRDKKSLKFKNFNDKTDFDSSHDFSFPDFTSVNYQDEIARFPSQDVEEKPKRMRDRIGLPINSSLSNSSEEKYQIPQRSLNSRTSSESLKSDLENLWIEVPRKSSGSTDFFY